MKRSVFFFALVGIVVLGTIVYFSMPNTEEIGAITVPVQFGEFKVSVTTTGELEAQKSEDISGPGGLREFRIWQVKINDIVPDGTVVDSGQWVAELDRSDLENSRKDLESELEKLNSQYIKACLDTTMDLRKEREEIVNLRFALEEIQIKLDQSKYEPPATIRQITIDYQKTERSLEQAEKNYVLKHQKAVAETNEVLASLNQKNRRYKSLLRALSEFTVKAPKSGMVIYRRDWNGAKRGVGSNIEVGWDNVVAELPDLTKMNSKTYVNEVDISKVHTGQRVAIGIDAFPNRSYEGVVTTISNVGQLLQGTNVKVFEVMVMLLNVDSILRPAMTSKNDIITAVLSDVCYVPLEAVHYSDAVSYVIMENKLRREVKLGISNDNYIVIEKGVKQGEKLFLSPPENHEQFHLEKLKNG